MTGTVVTVPVMTDAVPPEYGRWLARTRTSVGLTQAALADLVDVTVTTIARYEVGMREPRQATRELIHQILDERRKALDTDEPQKAAV